MKLTKEKALELHRHMLQQYLSNGFKIGRIGWKHE